MGTEEAIEEAPRECVYGSIGVRDLVEVGVGLPRGRACAGGKIIGVEVAGGVPERIGHALELAGIVVDVVRGGRGAASVQPTGDGSGISARAERRDQANGRSRR